MVGLNFRHSGHHTTRPSAALRNGVPVTRTIDIIYIRSNEVVVSLAYSYDNLSFAAPHHEQELAAILEQKLQSPAP